MQAVGGDNPYVGKYIVFTPTAADGQLTFTTAPEGDHTLLLDNIRIVKGRVATPVHITVSLDASGLRIAWPADATDYKLESTTQLPGGWTADTSPVSVDGNQNVVIVSITGGTRFYRLRK